MPQASRVRLVPPHAWDEERLLAAARTIAPTNAPVRPGDDVGGLVVVGVEPVPGAALADATELEVLPRPRAGSAPLVDLLIMLDHSESMGAPWSEDHSRLDAAQSALRSFLAREVPGVATVAVLGYARAPRLLVGLAAVGHVHLPEAPRPHGPSHTGAALNAALAHLAGHSAPGRCQAVLMLTDGVGEVAELLRAAERAKRLKVPIHIIAFAPEVDDVLAEVAQVSGGSVQQAALPLEIEFVHEGGA